MKMSGSEKFSYRCVHDSTILYDEQGENNFGIQVKMKKVLRYWNIIREYRLRQKKGGAKRLL